MPDQPNILIFMTDQQRGDTAPPWGRAITPNLDRLAREGVTFSRTYCPSPHCCPSRATFHTGLFPSQHGVWNNVDVGNALSRGPYPGTRIFGDDLRDAGYRLYFSGKWHVSAVESPADRGWAMRFPDPAHRSPGASEADTGRPPTYEWANYEKVAAAPDPAERREAEILRPGYGTYTHYGEGGDFFIAGWDQRVTEDAEDFIRNREPGAPWCHFVGTLGPHDPYFAPQAYIDLYDLDEIALPDNFHDAMADRPGLYRRTRDRFDQLTEREQREALRRYLAFCSYEDALFGRLFTALEETGQLDNTIVLYCSDHGDYAAEHGLWCKGLPCFQGAYHVPAIAWWPKGITRPGRDVDAFVSLADFAPTLLALAGIDPGRPFAGRSLVPFLRGETPVDWRDAVFTQTNGNELYGIQRSVMTRDWKYVYNGFDYDELYDLRSDPGETRNRATDPACAEVVKELSGRLWRFARDHDDVCINPYVMVALAPHGPAEAFR